MLSKLEHGQAYSRLLGRIWPAHGLNESNRSRRTFSSRPIVQTASRFENKALEMDLLFRSLDVRPRRPFDRNVSRWNERHPRGFWSPLAARTASGLNYQMFHALGMMLLGAMGNVCWRWRGLSAACMLLGVVLFSGGLYGWVLSNQKWMVMIVPLGGLSFIAGWFFAMISVVRGPESCDSAATCGSQGGTCHEH